MRKTRPIKAVLASLAAVMVVLSFAVAQLPPQAADSSAVAGQDAVAHDAGGYVAGAGKKAAGGASAVAQGARKDSKGNVERKGVKRIKHTKSAKHTERAKDTKDASIVAASRNAAANASSDDELAPHEDDVVLVQVPEGTTREQLNSMLADVSCVDTSTVSDEDLASGIAMLSITDGATVSQATAALEDTPGIEGAQPNYVYTAMDDGTVNDALASRQWALSSVGAYGAWSLAKCEHAVAVAVIDSGVYVDPDGEYHEDLKDNITGCYRTALFDGTTQTKAGVENDPTAVKDADGHGTHVAGIVSAEADNGIGVAGVSYNAGLVIIKASQSDDSGDARNFTTYNLRDAYKWIEEHASEHSIRVANMSIGASATGDVDAVLTQAINDAYSAGILTVCAGGNLTSQSSPAYTCYPGDFANCLSVIGLKKDSAAESGVSRASNSNYNTSGSEAKTISAPGASILSTYAKEGNDGLYSTLSGTSMAAPLVAGVAALVCAADEADGTRDLGAEDVKGILERTALDLGDEGFDEQYGYGEVDAAAAVAEAMGAGVLARVLIDGCVVSGLESKTYNGKAQTQGMTVSLGTKQLVSGVDYTLAYENNTNAGIATVSIIGQGNYTGTASRTFTIRPAALSSMVLSGTTYTYTGAAKNVDVKVMGSVNGSALQKNRDYTVACPGGYTNAGTHTVTVTGKGNYTGKLSKTFTINKALQVLEVRDAYRIVKASKARTKTKLLTFKTTGRKTALQAKKLTKAQKKGIKSIMVSGSWVKVTVKKGAKKGLYKIKVHAQASRNFKASAYKTIKIRIK